MYLDIVLFVGFSVKGVAFNYVDVYVVRDVMSNKLFLLDVVNIIVYFWYLRG